jgi:GT2 family glycosyltransferase
MMARSPLPADGLPGPALLGFLAGAAVVRRHAFLEAGGYEPRFFLGGEEALLALDLVSSGWSVVYAPQLIVHHYPSAERDSAGRRHFLTRNALWVAWMRLPLPGALAETWRICRNGLGSSALAPALADALRGLPWALGKREVIPDAIGLLYRELQRGVSARAALTPDWLHRPQSSDPPRQRPMGSRRWP